MYTMSEEQRITEYVSIRVQGEAEERGKMTLCLMSRDLKKKSDGTSQVKPPE